MNVLLASCNKASNGDTFSIQDIDDEQSSLFDCGDKLVELILYNSVDDDEAGDDDIDEFGLILFELV